MPFSVPSFVSQQPIILLSYMKNVRFVNFFATFTNFDTNKNLMFYSNLNLLNLCSYFLNFFSIFNNFNTHKNLLFYSILNLLTVCCSVSDCSANEEASSASL